jgi:hypothetical protein
MANEMIIDRTTLTRNLRPNYVTRVKLVELYLFSFIIYKFVLLSYIQDGREKE